MKISSLKRFASLTLFLLLFGCAPSNLKDFKREGQEVSKSLIRDLREIETKEELIEKSSRLKKKMNHLAKIMIKSERFKARHTDEEEIYFDDGIISEQLKAELSRIYQIEGAPEIIEAMQEEALEILDHYQKKELRRKVALKEVFEFLFVSA